jgi:hypothetical protein
VRGVAEAGELLGVPFGYVRRNRHEKIKVGAGIFSPDPEYVVCATNELPFIVYVTSSQVTGNGLIVEQQASLLPVPTSLVKSPPTNWKQFTFALSEAVY